MSKMFTQTNIKRIRESLKPFENTVAFDRFLPEELRKTVPDYDERVRRRAAVLVPLVNVDGVASVLFTVRAVGLKTHAAQVSFPGGHLDEGETFEQAASRELHEETELVADEILGQWSSARAYTGTMVVPVLGYMSRNMTSEEVKASGTKSPQEVSEAFHLPIEHLIKPEYRHLEILTSFKTTRFLGGSQPVWGLTAFFLDGILKDVLAPALDLDYPPTEPKRQHL